MVNKHMNHKFLCSKQEQSIVLVILIWTALFHTHTLRSVQLYPIIWEWYEYERRYIANRILN